MVNVAVFPVLLAQLEHAIALGCAVVWGYAAGRPIKRAIIRKWGK